MAKITVKDRQAAVEVYKELYRKTENPIFVYNENAGCEIADDNDGVVIYLSTDDEDELEKLAKYLGDRYEAQIYPKAVSFFMGEEE